MTQSVTVDEAEGRAVQPELPMPGLGDATSTIGAAEVQFKITRLLEELDLVPADLFAKALGVAEQTLAGWRSGATGPDFVKLGKGVFYRREDIKAWIARNIVSPE
jgi:predicted DNA-binding transcriptional regulator AlpA